MPFKSVSPRPVKRRRKKGRYLKPPNKGGEKRYPANPGNVIQYPQKQSLRLTFFFRVSTMGICDVKEIKEPQEPAVRPHAGAGWSKHKGASECLPSKFTQLLSTRPHAPHRHRSQHLHARRRCCRRCVCVVCVCLFLF